MYIYPKLPAVKTYSFFRIGGNGLANCMFITARAIIKAKKYNIEFIEPTWFNLSIGTYIRGQKDKRHYLGLFNNFSSNSDLKKVFLLLFGNKIPARKFVPGETYPRFTVFIEEGLGNYFEDLRLDHQIVSEYFRTIVKPELLKVVDTENFSNTIAVHVRLGDYSQDLRIPIGWYRKQIENINRLTSSKYRFLLFSDGTELELKELLIIDNVEFYFAGNAIADIIAISRCQFLLGSDSTFSGWGAYLGQVPSIFAKKHFGRILENEMNEIIVSETQNQHAEEELINRMLVNRS